MFGSACVRVCVCSCTCYILSTKTCSLLAKWGHFWKAWTFQLFLITSKASLRVRTWFEDWRLKLVLGLGQGWHWPFSCDGHHLSTKVFRKIEVCVYGSKREYTKMLIIITVLKHLHTEEMQWVQQSQYNLLSTYLSDIICAVHYMAFPFKSSHPIIPKPIAERKTAPLGHLRLYF